MRKLFAFVLLLLPLAVSAQTDKTFMSVDWDKIKAEVNANPQHVQQLVDILINVDADTTLTAEDKILAVYGRTYLNNGRDMFMELDMSKARNEGKFDVAATLADKVLASNPLNTNAIVSKIYQDQAKFDQLEEMKPMLEQFAQTGVGKRWIQSLDITLDSTTEEPVEKEVVENKKSNSEENLSETMVLEKLTDSDIEKLDQKPSENLSETMVLEKLTDADLEEKDKK